MAGNKHSFRMSPTVAARPESEPARWREVAQGVMKDGEGNLFVANSLLRFGEDIAPEVEAARAAGKQVKFDDLGLYDAGVDGVYRDSEGNLTLEDSSLKSRDDVAKLLRQAVKAKKSIVCLDQQKPKAATPKAKKSKAQSTPTAAQAAPAQAATAASAPAEEVVAPAPEAVEPVQEAPAVDVLPVLPAAPVASAPAPTPVPVAKKEESTEGFNSLKWIGYTWAAMVVLFCIAFPGVGMLAGLIALGGIGLLGWEICRLAPNLWVYLLIGWAVGTRWFVSPAVGFIADHLFSLYTAQVAVSMAWLGTATAIWMVLKAKKAVIK